MSKHLDDLESLLKLVWMCDEENEGAIYQALADLVGNRPALREAVGEFALYGDLPIPTGHREMAERELTPELLAWFDKQIEALRAKQLRRRRDFELQQNPRLFKEPPTPDEDVQPPRPEPAIYQCRSCGRMARCIDPRNLPKGGHQCSHDFERISDL